VFSTEVNCAHVCGTDTPSLAICLGSYQIRALTLPLNSTASVCPSEPWAMSRTDGVYSPSATHLSQDESRFTSNPCWENVLTSPGKATDTSGGEPWANCCVSRA